MSAARKWFARALGIGERRGPDSGRGSDGDRFGRRLHQAFAAGHVQGATARRKGIDRLRSCRRGFSLALLQRETHDNVLFFTDRGRVFQTKVYEIPQATRTSKGSAIQNFLELAVRRECERDRQLFVERCAKARERPAEIFNDGDEAGRHQKNATRRF